MAATLGVSRISRFRGCLVGSVIGDCLGAPFEGESFISKTQLNNFITAKLEQTPTRGSQKVQVLSYTDDTAMTRCLAQSLIEHKGLNAEDLAKRFTEEFYKEPRRGYGCNVTDVFRALKESNYSDPFGPAKEQFMGQGSYGNGAAMRVAPIALFYKDKQLLVNAAKNSSLVTHSNPEGYKGATLQCLALNLALREDPIVPDEFLQELIQKMSLIDEETKTEPSKEERFYPEKLEKVRWALKEKDLSPEEAAVLLGNGVSAYESVPTAIYAFLRGLTPIVQFEHDSSFVRTLYLSIAIGGDTDTIACMACALSGAHQGIQGIPCALPPQCEGTQYANEQAEALEQLTLS